jgi:hypothetical protein
MTAGSLKFAGVAAAALLGLAACKTTQSPPPSSAGNVNPGTAGTTSGGTTTAVTPNGGTAAPATTGGGTSIPTLVSVNLQNVLNNLSVSLKVNRNNIPVTAQVPIDVAANVCGVSVSALAASVASGTASCTAKTTTPQLTQLVQQQMATGGSVTGGPQTMGTPTP